jgi:hypothetical protein
VTRQYSLCADFRRHTSFPALTLSKHCTTNEQKRHVSGRFRNGKTKTRCAAYSHTLVTARATKWPPQINLCAEYRTISHDAEMAKIEFTQILNELNRVEADAAVTDEEREIIDTKFAAPQLDDNVNEQLNQLELEGRSNSANRQSNCYVKRLKTFLLSKGLSDDIEKIQSRRCAIICVTIIRSLARWCVAN